MTEEELKRIARAEVDRLKGVIAEKDREIEKLNGIIARLKKWNKWFFYRVKFMRQCQKEYFRLSAISRNKKASDMQKDKAREESREWILKSKNLENEVDDEIMRISNVESRQEAIDELKKKFDDLEEVNLDESPHLKEQNIGTNNYWDRPDGS